MSVLVGTSFEERSINPKWGSVFFSPLEYFHLQKDTGIISTKLVRKTYTKSLRAILIM